MSAMAPDLLLERASVYRALALPFTFPEKATSDAFRDGAWQREILRLSQTLGMSAVPAVPPLELDPAAHETEFIALFEVGLGGAPCPLHSGHYGKERMIKLEEVVRFYRFFEFTPRRAGDTLPDHITTELTFMAHLATRQHGALLCGGDAVSPLRGQRDFVVRHLASWLPDLARRLEEKSDCAFLRQAGAFADAFIAWDCDRLTIACPEDANLIGARRHG